MSEAIKKHAGQKWSADFVKRQSTDWSTNGN